MSLKKLIKSFSLVALFLVMVSSTLAQTRTWYVDNQIGNDGRNGLSATIPVPDDMVTGPKRTLSGAQGAISEANAGDIIIVKNTGVQYAVATGEANPIVVTKKLTFRSTDGIPEITPLFQQFNVTAPGSTAANSTIFDSGEFKLLGGLTLTAGVINNSMELLTVSGVITRSAAAATVSGQLKYTGTIDFSYGATMTTGFEFPVTGTSFRHLTTTGGNLTIKSGTNISMTGVITTVGTLNLGGGTATISNSVGGGTHTFGNDVTNGTLNFQLGGAAATTQTLAGIFALPNIYVTTSNVNAQTLAIASDDINGTLTVEGNASVTTTAALVKVGVVGFTGNTVVLNGTGNVTLSGTPTTVNGNVLLSSTATAAAGSVIAFGGATTVKGNLTNNATLNVTNLATWNNANVGNITFVNAAHEITGNLVNNSLIAGTAGTTLDVNGFGNIVFANIANDVTVKGKITNNAKTTLTGAAAADVSGNGLITFLALINGDLRADNGIANTADFSTITDADVINNGRILIGTAAVRAAASTVGTVANPVGLLENSSKTATFANGNGDIVIVGVGTAANQGFIGTNVTLAGTGVGGRIIFGDENFEISGTVTNSRTHASNGLQFGTAGTAGVGVSIGGDLVNSGTNTTSFPVLTTGAFAVTGKVSSSANGTISFANITIGSFTIGGLVYSAGTLSVPASHNNNVTINGNVAVSGGTVTFLDAGGNSVIIAANNTSFTGGTVTTTGRADLTINSPFITIGGANTNTTFVPAGTDIVIGNPSPTTLATVTIGSFNPTIPGRFIVNNTTGLVEAVKFTGGTMTVVGDLIFQSGKVTLAGTSNITSVGDFDNTAGYISTEQGRVTLEGGGGQVFNGPGIFGNIEFKNTAGVAAATNVTLAGTIYLTVGAVNDGGNVITVNNATDYPTIVRNQGTFNQAPVFASKVNVTYIGGDKTAALELPDPTLYADKLQNLTVATTTGANGNVNTPSKGAVTVDVPAIVNGIITVNANQALVIEDVNLTMNGPSIVNNGVIANFDNLGSGYLVLAAPTGTVITGSGYLPNMYVESGSVGNKMDGSIALVDDFFGNDREWGGAGGGLDFNPATTQATGTLEVLATTTDASSLDLAFGAGTGTAAAGKTNLNWLYTYAGANTTVTALNNLATTDTYYIYDGTFTLNEGVTYTVYGPWAELYEDGTFNGDGTLKFVNPAAMIYSDGAAVYEVNTVVALPANTDVFQLDPTTPAPSADPALTPVATFTKDFTLSKGTIKLGDDLAAVNLQLTGKNFTMATGTSFAVVDAPTVANNEYVLGYLVLNPTVDNAPLQWSYSGTVALNNVEVGNDVDLVGAGTALTVYGDFLHTDGVFNFGTRNITIDAVTADLDASGFTAPAVGQYNRIAGSYVATTGTLILNTGIVNQGDTNFELPNVKFGHNISAVSPTFANDGEMKVTKKLTFSINPALDAVNHLVGVTPVEKLVVANGVDVYFENGTLDESPVYEGSINLHLINTTANHDVDGYVWPEVSTLVDTLTLATGIRTATLEGSRTVNKAVYYWTGDLAVPTAKTLTVADSSFIQILQGELVLVGTAKTSYGVGIDVEYIGDLGAYDSVNDLERPATVRNLTLTRESNVANSLVTFNTPVTVEGTLTLKNNLLTNTVPAVTIPAVITLQGDLVIAKDAYALATNPVFTFDAPLTFVGENTIVSVPATGATIGDIVMDKTNGTNTLTLTGGHLTTGNITFINGLIVTNQYRLNIPAPTLGGGQGFDRTQVVPGNLSHVVGNVAKTMFNNGAQVTSTEPRSEFPVGSLTMYRPVAITFNPQFGTPTHPNTTIVVAHVDSAATGNAGLPIADGVKAGVDVARYPNFYWNIYTTPTSVSASYKFDLELGATGFFNYDDINNVRIIRRHGLVSDIANQWLLQGGVEYDNEVSGGVPTVINRESTAGLRFGGAIFTLGLKTNLAANKIADYTFPESNEPYKVSLDGIFTGNIGELTYTAQSSNTSKVTAAIVDGELVVTPVDIAAEGVTITLTATDAEANSSLSTSFVVKVVTSIGGSDVLPTEFKLENNYPNPFNPSTTIKYAVKAESQVRLVVVNVLGQVVSELVNDVQKAGNYEVKFNANNLSSGMYIYKIVAKPVDGSEGFVQTKKMMLVK